MHSTFQCFLVLDIIFTSRPNSIKCTNYVRIRAVLCSATVDQFFLDFLHINHITSTTASGTRKYKASNSTTQDGALLTVLPVSHITTRTIKYSTIIITIVALNVLILNFFIKPLLSKQRNIITNSKIYHICF